MQHYTITLSRGRERWRDLEGEIDETDGKERERDIDETDGRERVIGFLKNSSIFAM